MNYRDVYRIRLTEVSRRLIVLGLLWVNGVSGIPQLLLAQDRGGNSGIEEELSRRSAVISSLAKEKSFKKAVEVIKSSIELSESRLGRMHKKTIILWRDLAAAYFEDGQIANCESCIAKLLNDIPELAFPHEKISGDILTLRGKCEIRNGKKREGIQSYEEAYGCYVNSKGSEAPETLNMAAAISSLYLEQKEYDKCIRWATSTHDTLRKKLAIENELAILTTEMLALAYFSKEDYDHSTEFLEEFAVQGAKLYGSDDLKVLHCQMYLYSAYMGSGKEERVTGILSDCESKLNKRLSDNPEAANGFAFELLGDLYRHQHKASEAAFAYEKAIEHVRRNPEAADRRLKQSHFFGHSRLTTSKAQIANLLRLQGRSHLEAGEHQEGIQVFAELSKTDHRFEEKEQLVSLLDLAECHVHLGHRADAQKIFDRCSSTLKDKKDLKYSAQISERIALLKVSCDKITPVMP